MPAYTNMAWPEDPYGTGQLWRREPPLLASFAVRWAAGDAGAAAPVSYAVAYLRMHRTQAVDLTSGVSFGFRAVTAAAGDGARELVRLFDLDAMRARRLAKVVAGCGLAHDLQAMQAFAAGDVGRGIRGLAAAWASPDVGGPGLARAFDILGEHEHIDDELAGAAAHAGIDLPTVTLAFEPQRVTDAMGSVARGLADRDPATQERDAVRAVEWLAACSTEAALIGALTGGHMLGHHTWQGSLNISVAMAANAWDCYASLDLDLASAPSAGRQ